MAANPDQLLTREGFKEAVFARDGGRCVACGQPGVDAHHLIERKLFADGGYYLDNGVTLCERCHLAAERTTLSADELRTAAGIAVVVLPAGFSSARKYDKWGNELGEYGTRYPGPLFGDDGCHRALAQGGMLGLFITRHDAE